MITRIKIYTLTCSKNLPDGDAVVVEVEVDDVSVKTKCYEKQNIKSSMQPNRNKLELKAT